MNLDIESIEWNYLIGPQIAEPASAPRLRIIAVPGDEWELHGLSVVAFSLALSSRPAGRFCCVIAGSPDLAVVTLLTKLCSTCPKGQPLHIVTDLRNVWPAFPPNADWLNKSWKPGGFRKKPGQNRDAWQRLSKAIDAQAVELTAGKPERDEDRSEVLELKQMAKDHTKRPPRQAPVRKPKHPDIRRTLADELRDRAVAKDRLGE